MLVFKARPRRDPAQREDLTESQKRIMRLMGKAMREVRDQIEDNEGLLMDALQHSSIDKVVALVTVEPWLAMQEELQGELQEELVAAGNRVKLPRIQKALATFRFDAPNKNASNFAVQQGAGLVTEVITSQRETIRNLVAAAQIGEGLPPKAMARQLKNTVGLTTQQAGWVRNFEERAISQSMAAGKTFDQALEGSAKATQRYHDKIHRYRTETIARTETLKASNAGRNEAWKQGVDGGYISPNAVKEWQAEGDACQICAPLNGEQVSLSESFPEGDPPRHPNCRCNVKLVDEIPTDIASMTDEQLDTEIESLISPSEPKLPTSAPNVTGPPPARNLLPGSKPAGTRSIADRMPKVEKISVDEFDEKIADMATAQFQYFGPGRKEGYVIQKATGYDALPAVGSAAEIDELVAQGWKQIYRGVEAKSDTPSADSMFEFFKTGDLFPGRGVFGSGTYAAELKERAVAYAGGNESVDAGSGAVWRMALSPDAKILKNTDVEDYYRNGSGPYKPTSLNEKYTSDTESVEFEFYFNNLVYDEGYAAMRMGYDAIEVYNDFNEETYWVILNRGKVAVQESKETGEAL